VAFAGPGTGLALAVVAMFIGGLFFARDSAGRQIMALAATVNVFWAILNLIPMLPLDGGNIASSVFDLVAPGRGRRLANYLSIPTALVVGLLAITNGMFLFALICGFAIWMNIQELRAPPAPPPSEAVIDVPAERLSNDVTPTRDERPS
jgi:Zn-dependent protease